MIDICDQFHQKSCLLRQLSEGLADANTVRCQHCETTADALDLSLLQSASHEIAGQSIAKEAGYRRVTELARDQWDATEIGSSAERTAASATGLRMRCPACGTAVNLSEADGPLAIECSNCGQSIRLITDAVPCDQQAGPRRLGHLSLVSHVSTGSAGAVWRALDTELDREVTVTIAPCQHLVGRDLETCLQEARASAALDHPNIVNTHDIIRQGDHVYVVTDLVEGPTLSDYLSANVLSSDEAARLCATIANALHHAHEHGVVHRDLKSSNIAINQHLHPSIMDLGLARCASTEITIAASGKILRTLAYMSPEQVRGDHHTVDRRSDIYALGVVLFEMLTNERPFRGRAPMLLHQIEHEHAPDVRKLNSAVSDDLASICLKCLEKSPQRRYQTAEALRIDLQRFLDGRPITARSVSALKRVWRWCSRRSR